MMNRTKSFIKILSVLSFLLMAGSIFSCVNLIGSELNNSEKMVTYHLCVTPEMLTSRSAYPAFDASQMQNYVYTLTQGTSITVNNVTYGTYNNGTILYDFTAGTTLISSITLTFYICDGSGLAPMWSGSATFTPSSGQGGKPVNLSVRFSPMSTSGTSILATTKGNIDLEIQTDSGCTVQCTIPNAASNGIAVTQSGNTCTIKGTSSNSVTQGEYVAEITVKDSSGKVVRRQTHTIYVWRGITTNAWYLGDGTKSKVLTISAATNEMEFYVRGTNPGGFYANVPAGVTVANASDSNSGSILNPLATVQAAIGKCTALGTDYRIYVSGTLYGQVLIGGSSSVNAQSISIIGMTGSTTDVIDGNFVSPVDDGRTLNISTAVSVTLKDVQVTGGKNTGEGGGIKVTDGGTLNLEGNTSITKNAAAEGAGIYCLGATVNMKDNVSVTNNTATGMGGGVFIQDSVSKLTISENVSISNNEANEGGGISACASATIEMNGGSISGNTGTSVENGGGGIRLWDSNMVMTGGQISENISPNIGGAISIGGSSSFEVSNSAYIPAGDDTNPNDIYLDSGNTVTIAGALTPPAACTDGIIATITPSSYAEDTQVLNISASPSPTTTLEAEHTHFAVTPQNESGSTKEWMVNEDGNLEEK